MFLPHCSQIRIQIQIRLRVSSCPSEVLAFMSQVFRTSPPGPAERPGNRSAPTTRHRRCVASTSRPGSFSVFFSSFPESASAAIRRCDCAGHVYRMNYQASDPEELFIIIIKIPTRFNINVTRSVLTARACARR
ncbi:hypothetical protein C8Q74DRAFT_129766 [Fomes fomentarius]|nr:hypothetical protein C8Q74DRAFT_129766 [Fomes fomentarius]